MKEYTTYIQMGFAGILIIALVAGFFMGLITPDVFVPIAAGVVTYYFGDRKYSKELDAAVESLKATNARIVSLDVKEKV